MARHNAWKYWDRFFYRFSWIVLALEVAYVVCVGTFVCYILTMIGQRTLRPTVVSVYNYVQPIVSVAVSLLMGIGVLKPAHALAVVLVFSGVWLVTKSKSRRDMNRAHHKK